MTTTTFVNENGSQRAAVYRLFARLWRAEVDDVLLRELREGDAAESFQGAGGFVPNGDEVSVLDQLAIDFCQLFLGPNGHVPPIQSVWNEGKFEGQANASLRRYLDVIGDRGHWLTQNPLDHLAVQLDVMGYLAEYAGRVPSDAPDQVESMKELSRSFFRDHLTWASQLCDSIVERCQTQFYRGVISMTADFLDHELDLLFKDAACRTAEAGK